MENFEFVSPTHFVFGKGAEEQVGSKLAERGARTVLLHFGGQSAVKSGLIDRVKASLDAQGIKHVELGGVRPNPEITLAREGIALCKEHDVDWVLAVGGGSVIDSAKAIAVGAHYDGDVWDFFETKQQTNDVLPIAVVLTIPAAGSEASKNTVVSNDELQLKSGYPNNAQRPKLAFMNPELTFTLPPFQTAAGLTDMFCHLLERFFDERRNIARRRIEPPDTRVLAKPGALPLRVAARGQLDPLHSLVKRDEPVESLHDLLVPDSLRRRHAFAKAPVEQPFHFRHETRLHHGVHPRVDARAQHVGIHRHAEEDGRNQLRDVGEFGALFGVGRALL